MDLHRWTLSFILLLLPLTLCFDSQNVVLKKRIVSGADVTPVCSDATENHLVVVQCKIQKRNNGALSECNLRYQPERRNESECDSRIRLIFENQIVFLHLMDLRPEDSGVYNCQCYKKGGIYNLNLSVTVEGKEQGVADGDKESYINVVIVCSSAAALIVIFGFIWGVIYKRRCRRRQSPPEMKEGEEMETYAALQKPSKDLYQTIVKRDSSGVSGSRHKRQYTETEYENIRNPTN